MRTFYRLVTLGAALALFGGPGLALAAAPPQYVTSSPANDEKVSSPPSSVSITFDQPLDSSSQITSIEDHCGHEVSTGSSSATANRLQMSMDSDAEGMYHVSYFVKGVGGVTGQQQGTVTFTVTDGPSCGKDHMGHMPGMHMGHHHGHHHKMNMHDHHHMNMGKHSHMDMDHGSSGMHMGHDMSNMDMGGHSGDSHSMDDMPGMHMNHEHHTTRDLLPLGITSTGANGDPGLDRAGMATMLGAVLLALGLGTVGGTVLRASEQS